MRLDTWKLQGDRFHFGLHGLGQEKTAETYSSDSLFAALLVQYNWLYGTAQLEKFVKPFVDGSPLFGVTSTYPYAGDVLFFPAPVGTSPATRRETSGPAKKLKKVRYLSEQLFRSLLDGVSLGKLFDRAKKYQGDAVLVSPEEEKALPEAVRKGVADIWESTRRPRVTIPRNGSTASLYFTGLVYYARDCGLWFGFYNPSGDAEHLETIETVLAHLGDAGLGGERSSGLGMFSAIHGQTLELPDPIDSVWMTLGRYLPDEDELSALTDPAASYKLAHVGGWLDSPSKSGQRRRMLNLLVEGSILGPLGRILPGKMEDVRPRYETNNDPLGHPVYRNGMAVGVGIKAGDS